MAEPLVCKQCGGPIDPETLTCKYCGTGYKADNITINIVHNHYDGKSDDNGDAITRKLQEQYQEQLDIVNKPKPINPLEEQITATPTASQEQDSTSKFFNAKAIGWAAGGILAAIGIFTGNVIITIIGVVILNIVR